MLIDRIPEQGKDFIFDYAKLGPNFAAAVRLLRTADFDAMPLGRNDIDGDKLFVLMQEYTQEEKEPVYEAHDRYADIQLLLRGSERFRWGFGAPGPLKGDLRMVEGVEPYVEFVLRENQFAVFLPGEAHAPGLPEKSGGACRKAVIKVLCAGE